jgi:uncharacterized protein (DUF1499 family)
MDQHDISVEEMLPACPTSPTCVSSLAPDSRHHVEPLAFSGPAEDARARLRAAILAEPGARIVADTERPGQTGVRIEIRAEFRSRLVGFVDDLTCVIEDGGVIQVRAAARVGFWDFAVNRNRVERIRQVFGQAFEGTGRP